MADFIISRNTEEVLAEDKRLWSLRTDSRFLVAETIIIFKFLFGHDRPIYLEHVQLFAPEVYLQNTLSAGLLGYSNQSLKIEEEGLN